MLELARLKRIQEELLATELVHEFDDVGIPTGEMIERPVRHSKERIAALKLASDNSKWIIGKVLPTPQALDINQGEPLEKLLDQLSDEDRITFAAAFGMIEAPQIVEAELVDEEEDPLK